MSHAAIFDGNMDETLSEGALNANAGATVARRHVAARMQLAVIVPAIYCCVMHGFMLRERRENKFVARFGHILMRLIHKQLRDKHRRFRQKLSFLMGFK
jgi:hypothetical protein